MKKSAPRWLRIAGVLSAIAGLTLMTGVTAAYFVTRWLAPVLAAKAGDAGEAAPSTPTIEIDFYAASGIDRGELEAFLADFVRREQLESFPMLLALKNSDGEVLVDRPVILRWGPDEQRMYIGKAGAIQFAMPTGRPETFTLVAPEGYADLEQFSIPLGTAYHPREELDGPRAEYDVRWDPAIKNGFFRQLWRMAASVGALSAEELKEQLRRPTVALRLPPPPTRELVPAEIYRLRRDSVVIIANLFESGRIDHASGFVLDASGVIATAYHVVDKPEAIARGVLVPGDDTLYPIVELLAADKPADVALLRIDAPGLVAVPLSEGDAVGSPVTLISHPGGEFYSMTQGYIGRYFSAMQFGRFTVKMMVTADFADGSSGAPVFNSRGAVTGIVSSTNTLGDQMVMRFAAPAESVRRLIREPD